MRLLIIILLFSLKAQAQIINASAPYRPLSTPLLLDLYPSARAYAFVKLRQSYSGNCVRVRRSSDNTEQDIAFLPSGHLDTNAMKTFVGANNGFITTIYCQMGNGDATQTNASQQPAIITAGVIERTNGFVYPRFVDASSATIGHHLVISNWHASTDVNVSCFSVYASNIAGSNPYLLGQSNINVDRGFAILHNATTRQFRTGTIRSVTSTGTSSVTFTLGVPLLRVDAADRANITTHINGVSRISVSDNNSNFNMPTSYFIGNAAFNSINSNLSIACIILYNTDQSSNRTAIETILNSIYTIY